MPRRILARLTVIPAENGGHIVEHEFERPAVDKHPLSYEMPEKHVFGADEHAALQLHIAKSLGLKGN